MNNSYPQGYYARSYCACVTTWSTISLWYFSVPDFQELRDLSLSLLSQGPEFLIFFWEGKERGLILCHFRYEGQAGTALARSHSPCGQSDCLINLSVIRTPWLTTIETLHCHVFCLVIIGASFSVTFRMLRQGRLYGVCTG